MRWMTLAFHGPYHYRWNMKKPASCPGSRSDFRWSFIPIVLTITIRPCDFHTLLIADTLEPQDRTDSLRHGRERLRSVSRELENLSKRTPHEMLWSGSEVWGKCNWYIVCDHSLHAHIRCPRLWNQRSVLGLDNRNRQHWKGFLNGNPTSLVWRLMSWYRKWLARLLSTICYMRQAYQDRVCGSNKISPLPETFWTPVCHLGVCSTYYPFVICLYFQSRASL